ncbi:MAG: lipoyl(octanoyl) transferase LipB [Desulfobacterota bacterium]|nr:lipoyl(octanoyl) transferase LipB [Thermodesulfobacteriota bacterium]
MQQRDAWVLIIDRMPYNEAFTFQKKLVAARAQDKIKDIFILLQHNPVFTANRESTFRHILAPPDVLAREGIEVCKTDRGGDVTYHGPGQITGYLIIDLKQYGRDLHAYIRNVEQLLIDALAEFGITGARDKNHPGVWVGHEKIAAIGIAVKSGWITMHGFALNVNPNMDHYKMIIACGIFDKGVTSMERQLGRPVQLAEVYPHLIAQYEKIFNVTTRHITMEDLSWL